MNIKNNQKGFVAQGIMILVALAIIAAIAYYVGTKNVVAPKGGDVVVNATTTVTDAKCANGATNYPHCNADLLNISELKSLDGITNSGSSFTIKYPKGYVFFKYSCNINGIAFWPESQPRVIPTGNACPQAMINAAPIIVTTETNPQLTVVDQNYKEDAKNFTIITSTIQNITEQDLKNGWYYGSLNQKKIGTPTDWTHIGEGTRSATWSAPSTSAQPSITVLSPNGGENWKIGQTYLLSFKMEGDLGMKTVKLNRYSDDGVRVGSITIGTTNTDNLSFKIPAGTDDTKGAAARYKIQVIVDKYADGRGVADESDNYFSITPASMVQPTLAILSPNSGENWVKGTTKTIRWSNPSTQTTSGVGGPQDEIAIFINSQTTDTNPLLKTIVTGLNKNATSYDWNVGSNAENTALNGSYYIKVCRKSFTCDWSDKSFTITN